jgi:hypothetical protein
VCKILQLKKKKTHNSLKFKISEKTNQENTNNVNCKYYYRLIYSNIKDNTT